jgi:hypothetical protein
MAVNMTQKRIKSLENYNSSNYSLVSSQSAFGSYSQPFSSKPMTSHGNEKKNNKQLMRVRN